MTSSILQSRKWQLIGMSQWCRSALCGYPLPALTDNWTHGAASRHTIAPISHTTPSPRSRSSYYSFPVPLRGGGWVGLSTQYVSNLLKVACSEPGVSRLWRHTTERTMSVNNRFRRSHSVDNSCGLTRKSHRKPYEHIFIWNYNISHNVASENDLNVAIKQRCLLHRVR